MKRAFIRLACATVLAAAAAFVTTSTRVGGYLIGNWWNDAANIIMDDVFLPAATFSSPAQFQLAEWNEVDVTTNDHPFLISGAPQFSFGANDGDNTMGFLGEAGLNSEYGLSYASALAWTACWSSGTIVECDVMLDPTLAWTLTPSSTSFFQSTVLHETGHVRGLQHVNSYLSMQNAGGSVDKILRGEDLYMDDKEGVRVHATHVPEYDIVMYNKWHDGSIPQWMTSSPTTVRVGQTVNFNNITVENRGTFAFGLLEFGIYQSTNDFISTGDTLLNTGFWSSFGRFSASTFNWSAQVASIPDCGTRYFGGIIDYNNAYGERYEGNNNVTFVNGTPTPAAFSILLERDGLEPDDTFGTARPIVLPFNNANLSIDQDMEQDFYRFTVGALSQVSFTASFTHASGDIDMDLRDAGNVVLQSSTGVTNSETITRNLGPGTYYLRVYGFSGGSCNRYSLAGSSVLLVPDIAVSPASWSYGTVLTNSFSDRVFTVSNTGNLDLHVSASSLIGANAGDFSIQSGGGLVTIAPSGSHPITVRFAPSTAGAKVATLRIASDDPNENPFDVPLNGTGQLPVNLRMSLLTGPVNVSAGQTVNLSNTVLNDGGTTAGTFNVGLYLSADNTCTTGDTLLTTRNILSLAAGASNNASTPVLIPAATPLGPRYFCAIADSGSTQPESNESDNTRFQLVNVVPTTPTLTLKVNGLHPVPPVVTTSGPIALTLDIGASTWTTALDWYWLVVINGTPLWITAGGPSATPAPLVHAVPSAVTNLPLLNLTLPPGSTMTNVFLMLNGGSTVAVDFITANVTSMLTSIR